MLFNLKLNKVLRVFTNSFTFKAASFLAQTINKNVKITLFFNI